MINHLHRLLTPEQADRVPQVLISVGRRSVQSINCTYGRTGTRWQGRYKSAFIQVETSLLFYQRYIELDPVRAGMVTDPADYRWSSDRANACGASDALLSPHPLYLALGADDNARRAAYRELFRVALDEQPLSNRRLALNQNQPIGDARFYREIEAMTGQRWELRRRGRPRKRDDNGSARDAGGGELPRRQIDSDPDDGPQSMRFRSAAELTPKAVAAITEQVRIRVLRWFARSGLIERDDARDMLAWENSGFSLDAAVCVAANDRAGLERLLWPCVRLIHVRFVDHCCRPQPKRRCPFLAGCGRWGRPASSHDILSRRHPR